MPAAVEHVFAHVGAASFDAALAWYERLFGRPPELVPKDGEAAWQLTETAWFTLGGDARPTGRARTTVLVDDLAAQLDTLAARGVAPGEVETAPGLFRRVALADLEGNTIVFAQSLAGGA